MRIDVTLETWPGSPVIRIARHDYRRVPAFSYNDLPAGLTPREAVFYRNLIRIAEAVGSAVLPVDFEDGSGTRLYFDRGCIKIAEYACFIEKLRDGPSGVVDTIQLRWKVERI